MTTDAAATSMAALWLLALWIFNIRPLWINRRQPLYTPPITGPWTDPERQVIAA